MNGRDFRPETRQGKRIASPLAIVEGFLDQDLAPATNSLTGATTAEGTVIEWQSDVVEYPEGGTDKGNWNANTNTPALSDGSGTEGDYYTVSVAGTTTLDGETDWEVGERLDSIGGVWLRALATFQGEWDADANDPTLASGVGTEGQWYRVSVAGLTTLDGETDWRVAEKVIFHSGEWQRATSVWLETTSKVLVTNRDTTLAMSGQDYGSRGDYFKAAFLNGEWRPIAGGGGVGNEWINFSVYEICPSLPDGAVQAVWAQVTRTSCQSSVSVGDIVLVYDVDNCWFNVPIELLSTLRGRADLTASQNEQILFCAEYRDLGACFWQVSNLCCYEEAY